MFVSGAPNARPAAEVFQCISIVSQPNLLSLGRVELGYTLEILKDLLQARIVISRPLDECKLCDTAVGFQIKSLRL